MRYKNQSKRLGFSLMEVLLAAAIVAILALLTVPIINRQLSKSDEYSYYMAYKTVEKMAGQIAVAGDPTEIPASTTTYKLPKNTKFAKSNKLKTNPFNKLIASISTKFANSQAYILSRFIPKSIAATGSCPEGYLSIQNNNEYGEISASFSSEDYDQMWVEYKVCVMNQQVVSSYNKSESVDPENGATTDVYTPVYYTKEILGCDNSSSYHFDTRLIYTLGIPEYDKNGKQVYVCSVSGDVKTCNLNTDFTYLRPEYEDNDPGHYVTRLDNGSQVKPPSAEQYCKLHFSTLYSLARAGDTVSVDEYNADNFFDFYDNTKGLDVGMAQKVFGWGAYVTEETASSDGEWECSRESCALEENPEECLSECQEEESDPEEELDEDQIGDASFVPGSCNIKYYYQEHRCLKEADDPYTPEGPKFDANWCTEHGGYINAINVAIDPDTGYGDSIDCQCKTGFTASENYDRVCVPECSTGAGKPYAIKGPDGKPSGIGACCKTDFNEKDSKCCPEKSLYDPVAKECKCISGYVMNASGTCDLNSCPAGYHKTEDNVCVKNPPIIKADRFCEEIKSNWNTSDSYCGRTEAFTDAGGYAVNQQIYEAATGVSGAYLSIESKAGAFSSIKPNIVLSNGLKMWVLGDKSASIPGLSYYNSTVNNNQNMCKRIDLGATNTKPACDAQGGFFCNADKVCLSLAADPTHLKDPRTCCSSTDFYDIQLAAKAQTPSQDWHLDARAYAISGFTVFVDINGDKGDSTLWQDVYPFYIAANGTVYPGYPLDGDKTSNSTSVSLYTGGNSESQLPTDVYYYTENAAGNGRERKVAFAGVSYARAVCSARLVDKNTPYCLNLGEKFAGGEALPTEEKDSEGNVILTRSGPDLVGRADLTQKSYLDVDDEQSRNPCDKYRCFVGVRKKLKAF